MHVFRRRSALHPFWLHLAGHPSPDCHKRPHPLPECRKDTAVSPDSGLPARLPPAILSLCRVLPPVPGPALLLPLSEAQSFCFLRFSSCVFHPAQTALPYEARLPPAKNRPPPGHCSFLRWQKEMHALHTEIPLPPNHGSPPVPPSDAPYGSPPPESPVPLPEDILNGPVSHNDMCCCPTVPAGQALPPPAQSHQTVPPTVSEAWSAHFPGSSGSGPAD